MAARAGRRNGVEVHEVHGINTIVPVVAAKRTTGQRVLHDVVEFAVTGKNLELAIVEDIVGTSDARSDLVRPTKADGRVARAVGWQILLLKPNTQVQCQ